VRLTPPRAAGTPRTALPILTTRADFLRAAKGLRVSVPALGLQAHDRADAGPVRVGFTCSKKVGNAVARNRAKRRLREVARLILADHGQQGWDYVLIGRPEVTAARDFNALQDDLRAALGRIHR
jgi:ribonuclease P protein component